MIQHDLKKKIIVAHPGKQHSYRLASAVEKADCLYQYITTVYDSDSSFWMKIVKRVIGKKDKQRANNRRTTLIPKNKITQFCELRGIIVLAILRIDKSRKLYNLYNNHVTKAFGKKVAHYAIKHDVDAVICYDTSAMYCFDILKKKAPSIIRIIDNAAMNRYGLCKLYQELDRKYNILIDKTGFKSYLIDEKEAMIYKKEAFLANYHIAASNFSKQTITQLGIPSNQVFVIPYGVDASKIKSKNVYTKAGKLKVLYVGEISPQKGIYALLDSAEYFSGVVEFHIVGSGYEKLSTENQMKIKKLTKYHGYLLQEELFKLYSECDVFLFPSLGDGFGFVVIEAMAAGLPVVCSSNSVGKDAVTEYEDGFVFQAGNTEEMNQWIKYFINNRNEVERMGRKAAEKAKHFSWVEYDQQIESFLGEVLQQT